MQTRLHFDIKYLKSELAQMFSSRYLLNDLTAGLIVALVAIPLSLAVALASSVPPEVGLISSVIGGIVAAIFGGTTLAITGPAIAMTVIISQCVQNYGISSLLIMGTICGGLQILFGVLRLGRFTKLIPRPIVSAFIAAIGVIIVIGQLPSVFQVSAPDQRHLLSVITHTMYYVQHMNGTAALITLLTIVLVIILPRFLSIAIGLLIAIAIPTGIVYFANLTQVQLVGIIPHSLPNPHLPDFSQISDWKSLLMSSLAVFAIASLETLLSSNAVDSLSKGKLHKPNQELIGQGIANISVAAFGGVPVTGVIARSSINVAAGAKTRRAGIIHALIIVALIYLFPRLLEIIPVAVLAAILVIAGLKMLNIKDIISFWKNDKLDLFIYLVTFISIISTDLVAGIQTGLILALVLAAIKLLATKSSIQLWSNKSVIRISLSGNMSFWSFEALGSIQDKVLDNPNLQFVVFEFNEVQGMDSTGARHLVETAQEISNHKIQVIFHGVNAEQNKLLSSTSDEDKPYILTVTENDIKQLLEQKGISHQATDVLRHGISKFSGRYAQEHKELIDTLAQGQKPHTLLITCSDSRLNPNAFFSASLGELFIVRNVGNVIPPYTPQNKYSEGAAIEFALGALEIRNVVVCAHTECGAIKASIKDFGKTTHSGLDNWLQLIKDGYNEHAPHNADEGVRVNLLNQVTNLKTYPIVNQLLTAKELTISAWLYDVHSATIMEWDDEQHKFISTAEKDSVEQNDDTRAK